MNNLKKIQVMTENLNRVHDNMFDEINTLEFILDSVLEGYWDWDIVTNYEYLSPSLKKQLGYEDHELENSLETWMRLINPEDLKNALEIYDDHIKSKGETEYKVIARYAHKDGHEITVLCKGKVVTWDGDKPLRMVGAHVDITGLLPNS
jgi:PAS domain S-box-containing protein